MMENTILVSMQMKMEGDVYYKELYIFSCASVRMASNGFLGYCGQIEEYHFRVALLDICDGWLFYHSRDFNKSLLKTRFELLTVTRTDKNSKSVGIEFQFY